jgi:hypothetical protein
MPGGRDTARALPSCPNTVWRARKQQERRWPRCTPRCCARGALPRGPGTWSALGKRRRRGMRGGRLAATKAPPLALACHRSPPRHSRGVRLGAPPRCGFFATPSVPRALWAHSFLHRLLGRLHPASGPRRPSPRQTQHAEKRAQASALPHTHETRGSPDQRLFQNAPEARDRPWLVCQPLGLWARGVNMAISTFETLPNLDYLFETRTPPLQHDPVSNLLPHGECGLQELLPLNDRPPDGLTIHIEQRRKLILGQGTNTLRWLLAHQGPESPLENMDLAHG